MIHGRIDGLDSGTCVVRLLLHDCYLSSILIITITELQYDTIIRGYDFLKITLSIFISLFVFSITEPFPKKNTSSYKKIILYNPYS